MTLPPNREWTPYVGSPPPPHALVRFWNEANGRKWTGRAEDLSPGSILTYLWYKVTGIEKEQHVLPD